MSIVFKVFVCCPNQDIMAIVLLVCLYVRAKCSCAVKIRISAG